MTQDDGGTSPGDMPQYQQPGWPNNAPGGFAPAPGMMAPGMAMAPVPAGLYYDAATGLTLPNGTELASHGRRVGAYFFAALLWVVTLFIGYAIWGLVTWGKGRTPVQQLLHMRCWKVREMTTASWGTMFLRGLCMWVLDGFALGGLVSFVMFLVNKDRRTLYDLVSGVVVLHDPNDVLP